MTSKELAKIAYNALDDKKGVNITIIDISEISIIADYFIIAGGTNENQVKALAGNVEDEFAKAGLSPKHVEGYTNANWILMKMLLFTYLMKMTDFSMIWKESGVTEKS